MEGPLWRFGCAFLLCVCVWFFWGRFWSDISMHQPSVPVLDFPNNYQYSQLPINVYDCLLMLPARCQCSQLPVDATGCLLMLLAAFRCASPPVEEIIMCPLLRPSIWTLMFCGRHTNDIIRCWQTLKNSKSRSEFHTTAPPFGLWICAYVQHARQVCIGTKKGAKGLRFYGLPLPPSPFVSLGRRQVGTIENVVVYIWCKPPDTAAISKHTGLCGATASGSGML